MADDKKNSVIGKLNNGLKFDMQCYSGLWWLKLVLHTKTDNMAEENSVLLVSSVPILCSQYILTSM